MSKSKKGGSASMNPRRLKAIPSPSVQFPNPKRQRRCPTCKAPAPQDISKAFFPFCSIRCQRIDLGRWLEEDYAIPGFELDA